MVKGEVERIHPERVAQTIVLVRGQRVLLDRDLAVLYGVETRVLNQAVRRNIVRFPPDFLFMLTREEIRDISQIVTCSSIKHARSVSAFTEQGVAMLSSVLKSERAIAVNIAIMRAFVRLREAMSLQKDLVAKLADLERKIAGHDESIRTLFDAIRQLMAPPAKARRSIGFRVEEAGPVYRVRRSHRTGRKS
jgi:ORF6N domain-containing protein